VILREKEKRDNREEDLAVGYGSAYSKCCYLLGQAYGRS
jgi:hypothetical protein